MKKLKVGNSINFKDGRVGIVEDYDDKYFYVRDSNTNLIKVKKQFKDGTWSVPFTLEQANDLYDLVCTDKYDDLSIEDKKSKLYHLFGDDKLFDDIDDTIDLIGSFKKTIVKKHLENLINHYKRAPEDFRVKCPNEVMTILEKIIKD